MKPCERKILWGEFYAGPFPPSSPFRSSPLRVLVPRLGVTRATPLRSGTTTVDSRMTRIINGPPRCALVRQDALNSRDSLALLADEDASRREQS